jgi:hypothetical protein
VKLPLICRILLLVRLDFFLSTALPKIITILIELVNDPKCAQFSPVVFGQAQMSSGLAKIPFSVDNAFRDLLPQTLIRAESISAPVRSLLLLYQRILVHETRVYLTANPFAIIQRGRSRHVPTPLDHLSDYAEILILKLMHRSEIRRWILRIH